MTVEELVIKSRTGRVQAWLRFEAPLTASDRELLAECRRAIEQVFRERAV